MPVIKSTCAVVFAALALGAIWSLGFLAMSGVAERAFIVASGAP